MQYSKVISQDNLYVIRCNRSVKQHHRNKHLISIIEIV